jgi:hypothetical protein
MSEETNITHSSAAYRGLLGLLLAVCALAYMAHYPKMMFIDCDSPWHLAAGDLIRSLGHVPMQDPWAFTTSGQTWYNISWAYDVAISWINSMVGLDGLQLVVIAVGCVFCGVLFYICKQRGVGIFAAFLATYLACFMSIPSMQVRPQLVSMLLLALCYYHLYEACIHGRKRHLLLLPLYAALWVNVHGGFLALFVTIGAFGLEAIWRKDWVLTRTLMLTGVVSIAACLLNPYGTDILHATMLTLQSPLSFGYISEWMAPRLSDAPHIYVYVVLLFALPYIGLSRLSLADKILAIFWGIMTLQSIRYLGIWLIFITPMIAVALEHLPRRFHRWQTKQQEYAQDLAKPKAGVVTSSLLILVFTMFAIPNIRHTFYPPVAPDPKLIPVAEVNYLLSYHKGERVFSHYGYGGYIIYAARGSLPIMMDGRANTVYSLETTEDFLQVDRFRKDWEQVLNRYDIRVVLLPKYEDPKEKTPYIADWYFTHAGWKLAFSGDVANVYVSP